MTQESFAIALWHFVCFSDTAVEKKKSEFSRQESNLWPSGHWFRKRKLSCETSKCKRRGGPVRLTIENIS